MNILFICCAYSEIIDHSIFRNSRRGYQFAAQVFQNSLIEGFLANDINITVLSFPSLSTFPFGNKLPFYSSHSFIFNGNKLGKSLPVLNLPFINKPYNCTYIKFIKQWLEDSHDKDAAIVVYGMNPALFKIVKGIQRLKQHIPSVLIVPDLPEYMKYNKAIVKLGLKEKIINNSYAFVNDFDGFILLTEQMKGRLGIENKPTIVIEGIYNNKKINIGVKKSPDGIFKIFYAGALSARYGIIDLLKAFHSINNTDMQLILCGKGDAVEEVLAFAKKDKRIIYQGVLPNDDVKTMQTQVSLLVNPRHSNEEFTKYSFPSKTMEYMASGTPTLMCKLPGLPEDYIQHLYLFDDESIQGFRNALLKIINLPLNIRDEKGRLAAAFIKENKNSSVQVKKIINIIYKIQK